MIRALLLAAVVCASILAGATFVGRAIDAEIQQRVTFMRGGQMLDCERVVEDDGRLFYRDCHQVP